MSRSWIRLQKAVDVWLNAMEKTEQAFLNHDKNYPALLHAEELLKQKVDVLCDQVENENAMQFLGGDYVGN